MCIVLSNIIPQYLICICLISTLLSPHRIDMTITPIEEAFALLNRYGLVYSSSDSEQVDGLTYAWKKLQDQVIGGEKLLFLCHISQAPFVKKRARLYVTSLR